MTEKNKPTIIDGIDVSGCKHFKIGTCLADYLLTDMNFSEAKCELCKNCYYKQLKRKEQECERLRFPMLDTNYAILTKEEFEQLYQLNAENEKLKAQLDVLEEDNKKLSSENDALYNSSLQEVKEDLVKRVWNLQTENKELAHYLACMTEQRNKANTTLQEIKKLINKTL